MKRAISLLLALAVAFGLSTVALAATDVPGALTPSPRISIVDGKPGYYKIDKGDLFLANTKDAEIVGFETLLMPGETYKFDVYLADASTADPEKVSDILGTDAKLLTKADIGGGTVKFRLEKGRGSSAIQTAKVKTKGSGAKTTYYVEIVTRDVYGTKMNEVEYELSATVAGKESERNLATAPAPKNLTFKVGFPTMEDDMLDVGEEGTVIIYNTAPVITKDQFTELAKNTNYKNLYIEAEDGSWTFKGKVAGMKDTNFYYDYDPDTDLLNKFPDQEFKFLNFRAGVNFPTNGEMRIDVSDVSDVYDTIYPYLYRDGKLTMINGTHDAGTDQLVFRTNYLGKFIITNKRITDTSLLPDEPVPEEDIIVEVPAPPPATNNPATGMPMDLTAVFGLISLAAGSLVSRKRK